MPNPAGSSPLSEAETCPDNESTTYPSKPELASDSPGSGHILPNPAVSSPLSESETCPDNERIRLMRAPRAINPHKQHGQYVFKAMASGRISRTRGSG
ncbi:hypothetical protein [Microcoleus sp. Pol12B5]|uniref:hypothetical protein n=1 Tax=Microcoleus sp. Pol12B5 TaxID=3055396 RepID=UPI002FD464BF